MSGQIPEYGRHFRLESLAYHPVHANRAYVLRRDPAWFIRSGKASKSWQVYWMTPGTGASYNTATAVGTPLPTLGLAMQRLLNGIDRGFYTLAGS
jgi:hypothetical protein